MPDLDYAKVTGRFALTVGDTVNDVDDDPDTVWCTSGRVVLTPLNTYVKVASGAPVPFTVGNAVIEADIDSEGYLQYHGKRYVNVVDLTSSKVNPVIGPNLATHRVTFSEVMAGETRVNFPEFTCRLTAAGTGGSGVNDLTIVAPVSPGAASPIYRGESGTSVQTLEVVDGDLVATLTDGTEVNAGELPVGPGGSDTGVAGYIDDPASATRARLTATIAAALKAGVLRLWMPNTDYVTTDYVLTPAGQIAQPKTNFTSGAGYNAANWTIIVGGSSVSAAVFTPPRLTQVGAVERETSRARLAQQRQDNASFVETWANANLWSPSTGFTVTNGRVYGTSSASNPAGGSRAITVSPTATLRMTCEINHVPGGTGLVGIGITTTASGAPLTSGAPGSMIWGFNADKAARIDLSASPAGQYSSGQQASQNAFDYRAGNTTTSPAAGTYQVTIIVDAARFVVSIVNQDGSVVYGLSSPRSALTTNGGVLTGVLFWNSDTRAASGSSIGPITASVSHNTGAPRAAEGFGPTVNSRASVTSDEQIIQTAGSYDSRIPTPVIMYHHGAGETETAIYADSLKRSLIQAIATQTGATIVACRAHGDNWGNPASADDYLDLYKAIRDRSALGPVFVLSQSMGGMSGLTSIAQAKIPGIAGWAGIYPATNLRAVYEANTFAPAIRTAYGIASDGSDYATKTAGYDPNLIDGQAFRGLPMRFYASPGDTVITKAANTDLFAAKVAPYASESTVQVCTGNHGDPSHFQTADLIAFIKRCVSTV